MDIKKCSIYNIDKDGKKHFVLSAPTIEEAEKAFDMLCRRFPGYFRTKIEWQYTYFDDEIAVGEVK